MSETGLDSHGYFLEIEEHFVDLRGAPLLLSPADWQVARRWHERQIPVGLIKSIMSELFARHQEKNPKSRVVSL